MKKEVSVLPEEVSVLAVQVSDKKQEEVRTVLNQIFSGTDEWSRQVDAIEVKSIDDKMSIALAETARRNAKNARLDAEKIFDKKRSEVQQLKSEYDLEDKLWLKSKQVMQLKFKAIEEKAKWKADFVKRFEDEQKEIEVQKRIIEVSKYAEINRIEFASMSNETFESFLAGLKSSYEAKIEAEAKAEAERIEAERIEKERIEAQAIENAKLKAEAEKREKEIAEERKREEEFRRSAEIKAAKERAEIEAKLKAEADAKAKIQAELEAKKEAERKIEQARIADEKAKELAAKKAAKAPMKTKLNVWVDSFEIPKTNIENSTTNVISAKFEAFKSWAKEQVEAI